MTPDHTQSWGPREFGYMFARLAIMWDESVGRNWRGVHPGPSEYRGLNRAVGHHALQSERDMFDLGWNEAKRARDAGEPVLAPTVQA